MKKSFLVVVAIFFYCNNPSELNANRNNPPNPPQLVFPLNNSLIEDTKVNFIWSCLDPENDALTYKLFLDTIPNPTHAVNILTNTNYIVTGLLYNKSYFWRVVASDGKDSSSSSTSYFNIYSAGINFNALYKNANYMYLRFYEDGTVINVNSTGTPIQVAQWFNKNYKDVSIGKFTVQGSTLSFSVTNSYGTVDYNGIINTNSMFLTWYSHVNQNSKTDTFNLYSVL